MRMWVSVLVLLVGCGSGSDENHGFLKVRLANSGPPVLADAARVSVTMLYQQCLLDFYGKRIEWRQDGREGAPVFDAWQGRLCSLDLAQLAPCEVESIVQNPEADLTVRYSVGQVQENQILAFGPLPDEALTGCPSVMRMAGGRVDGFDAEGTVVWEMATFEPIEAAEGQGQAVRVEVAPPG